MVLFEDSYQGFADEKNLCRQDSDAVCAAVEERALQARVLSETRFTRR